MLIQFEIALVTLISRFLQERKYRHVVQMSSFFFRVYMYKIAKFFIILTLINLTKKNRFFSFPPPLPSRRR